jgi:nucleoside-diphosphate-sugar epimerase
VEFRKAVIFGATGATGHFLCDELLRRKVAVRVVSRREEALRRGFGHRQVEHHPADLLQKEAAIRAADGCDLILHCVGLPYPRFRQHPPIARNTAEAMKATGARGLLVSSYYAYEPIQTTPITEDHPRRPKAFKARMRMEQEDILQQAGAAVTILPDFYGPWADLTLLYMVLTKCLHGRRVDWLGDLDTPRQYVYVPDSAFPIIELATREAAYGARWNVAGTGPITARDLLSLVERILGSRPRVRRVGPMTLRLGGLVSPLLRELVELYPLYTSPLALDTSKLRGLIGEYPVTPYSEGLRSMMQWMRAMG